MRACFILPVILFIFVLSAGQPVAASTIAKTAKAEFSPRMERQIYTVSQLCRQQATRAEMNHALPQHVLQAIALTESARWLRHHNRSVPWPWTVTVQGKGYYLASKNQAVRFVEALLMRGITNIDVGCMQINIHHHGKKFQSVSQILDPANNVAYSGQFLRKLYKETASWSTAIAYYHSRTPKFHVPYRERVLRNWDRVRTFAENERRERLASYLNRDR